MPRPDHLIVVTGTGTEVGKTWVSARLIERWRADGRTVVARKPVQSFEPGDPATDADVLAAASGEESAVVCPLERRYAIAMAPPMAATRLGLPPPRLSDLDLDWPADRTDIGLIEGAGGVASPLTDDGDTADLARAVCADVALLVADAGLGVVHAVRLAAAHLAPIAVVVYLNRFDPDSELHRANEDWLASRDGLTVATDVEAAAAALLTP